MRTLQLIDSLNAGGAERIAVTLANTLVTTIEKSYLCASREEGLLKETLNNAVGYLFLNKKATLDLRAIKRLNTFIKIEKINIIHAHSSSFFLATIIKLLNKNVKIVWHDHFGNRASLNKTNTLILKQCSKQFSHIFCVNQNLVLWSKNNLKCQEISFLPNFVVKNNNKNKTHLKGQDGKRIICLANLRHDKDHFNLLKAFKIVNLEFPEWTLHIVGKDFKNEYSLSISEFIKSENLADTIFTYGSCPDTFNLLMQSDIGVLSSKSEGLPVTLLEYGLAGLPVVVTNVGECSKVILNGTLGRLVPPSNSQELANALLSYIENTEYRKTAGNIFKQHILNNYSAENTVDSVKNVYLKINDNS